MDIQALKLNLVDKILKTQKAALLVKINKILTKEESKDWWDELPKEVQDSILEGLEDINKGKLFTHDQVVEEARQKYGFQDGSNLVITC